MALGNILHDHNQEIESVVATFQQELQTIITRAKSKVTASALTRLTVSANGSIERTAANAKILRNLSEDFIAALDDEGYQELIKSFVDQFGGQFTWFEEVLQKSLGRIDASSLMADVTFSAGDQKFLAQQQLDSANYLSDMVKAQANQLRSRAVMSIGGFSPAALAEFITERLDVIPGQAAHAAATAISTFYRTIADIGYQKIEEDKTTEITYRYVGPPSTDPVERPFCSRLMRMCEIGRTFTRAEIDKMDNGQMPDVFTTCGGFNCRHQWVIATVTDRTDKRKVQFG